LIDGKADNQILDFVHGPVARRFGAYICGEACHPTTQASGLLYPLAAFTQVPSHCVQTWVDPDTGAANNFLDSLKGISSNPEVVMLLILGVFAASHSGLAYLRPWGKLHGLNTPTHMCVLANCIAAFLVFPQAPDAGPKLSSLVL